jgi:hypothetical protein
MSETLETRGGKSMIVIGVGIAGLGAPQVQQLICRRDGVKFRTTVL